MRRRVVGCEIQRCAELDWAHTIFAGKLAHELSGALAVEKRFDFERFGRQLLLEEHHVLPAVKKLIGFFEQRPCGSCVEIAMHDFCELASKSVRNDDGATGRQS